MSGVDYSKSPYKESIVQPGLTFDSLRKMSKARSDAWGGMGLSWSKADWSNAMAGESGELDEAVLDLVMITLSKSAKVGQIANAVKKLRRHETNISQSKGPTTPEAALARIKAEIGDVATYLDLLATHCGLRLEDCVRDTYNAVSERENFPHRI